MKMKKNNITNVLIVLITLVSFCESQKHVDWFEIEPKRKTYPGHHTKISFKDPFYNTESNKKDLSDFTRHHVIPYDRLKLFFNNALKVPYFYSVMCEGMYNVMTFIMDIASSEGQFENISIGNVHKNLIMQLIFASSPSKRAKLLKDPTNILELKRMIHRFFVWFPPNIFIGPTDRSDDPGNDFELHSDFVIGKERYDKLLEINNLMKRFNEIVANSKQDISNKDQWGKLEFSLIVTVLESFKPLLGFSSVPFNIQNWEKIGEKWRIKHVFLNNYPKVYDVYNTQLLYTDKADKGYVIKDVDHDELRRKRGSGRSSHDICLYETIERQVKSSINETCVPENSSCACF